MQRIFVGLFLCSLFIALGGAAQSSNTPEKTIWAWEGVKVQPEPFALAMPYLGDRGMRVSGQLTETGQRVTLTDGNELYGWCKAYKDAVKLQDERIALNKSTDAPTAFEAGQCLAYVRGVVDSMPVGGEFSPGPKVTLSQYTDVVFNYLDEHPEMRDKQASGLVWTGLIQAFSKSRH